MSKLFLSTFAARRLLLTRVRWCTTEIKEPSKEPHKEPSNEVNTAALVEEHEVLQDKYIRALAEIENVRRRGQKQVDDAKVFAIQSFCKDLLEVSDILNLAVDAVDKPAVASNNHMKNLYDGIVMTKDVLLKTFDRHGLVIVSPEGQRFDPNFHDAIFQVPKEQAKHEPGHVEKVLKVGYSLHGRPIRAAQVGVVKL